MTSEVMYSLHNSKNQLIVRLSSALGKAALLKGAVNASEKAALDILLNANASLADLLVPPERSWEILKLLGTTGRLLWEGKKAIVDPFSPFTFYFEVEGKEEGALQICGKWKLGSQSSDVHRCAFFSPAHPAWLLDQGVVRPMQEPVPGKWLRKVLEGPALLDAKESASFLKEFEGEPCLQWKNRQESAPVDPIPFLQLHDRHGAFADLWFDYGGLGKVSYSDPTLFPGRKQEAEKGWESDLLETDFIRKIVDQSHYFCPLDKVAKSLTFLLEIGWKIFDGKGRSVCRQTGEQVDAELVHNALHIRAQLQYDTHEANLGDVVGAFNRRESFVEISPHAVALIDRSSLEARWGDLLEEERVAEGIAVPKRHFGLLSDFLEAPERALPDVLKEKIQSLTQLAPSASALPGKEFRGTLFSYQDEGLQWLKFLEEGELGGLLADEMGLGKTVQVLAFFSQLTLKQPCLIVVPTSLLFHWQREIERFLPGYPIYVHAGKERHDNLQALATPSLILTTYALFRIDAELFWPIDFQCIVLDEGQTIKNPDSQIAKALYPLKSAMRLIITGTPIENRLEDLWSLFHFLLPDLLGERKAFQAQTLAAQADRRHLERIQKKIRPFLLRRKKEHVALQLPPKLEQTVFVEMTEPQRTLYEKWLQDTQSGLLKKVALDGASAHRMQILEAILRLRQLCAHPVLTGACDGELFEMSGKCDRLFADLSEVVEEKCKVLVYSQFTQMLKIIEKEVKRRGWKYVYLDGSTRNREEAVRQFQEDEETAIFLISLKAGGVGLNLTAADYVFLYDPWWNEAAEQQAIDRAHRVGKRSTLIARRYITALSIEEKILRLKSHKKALSESLLDASEEMQSLSVNELLALLD